MHKFLVPILLLLSLPAFAGVTPAEFAAMKADVAILKTGISELFFHVHAGYGSTNTSIPRYTNTLKDTGTARGDWVVVSNDASLGASVTILKAGRYHVFASSEGTLAQEHGMGYSVNSTQLSTCLQDTSGLTIGCVSHIGPTTGIASLASCSFSQWFAAGDVVRPHVCTAGAPANTAHSMFKITKLSAY